MKARELLRALRWSVVARPRGVPAALERMEARRLVRLRRAVTSLSRADGSARLAALRAVEAAEAALLQTWTDVAAHDGEYVAVRRGEPATWAGIRTLLRSGAIRS